MDKDSSLLSSVGCLAKFYYCIKCRDFFGNGYLIKEEADSFAYNVVLFTVEESNVNSKPQKNK